VTIRANLQGKSLQSQIEGGIRRRPKSYSLSAIFELVKKTPWQQCSRKYGMHTTTRTKTCGQTEGQTGNKL